MPTILRGAGSPAPRMRRRRKSGERVLPLSAKAAGPPLRFRAHTLALDFSLFHKPPLYRVFDDSVVDGAG